MFIAAVDSDGAFDYLLKTTRGLEKLDTANVHQKLKDFYKDFISIDGIDAERFMRPPFGLLGDSAFVAKYDHLSAADRLRQMKVSADNRPFLEALIQSYGLAGLEDVGFIDVARTMAHAGLSAVGMREKNGTYSLGNGGTTALARCLLDEFHGHLQFSAQVTKISQADQRVRVTLRGGREILARYVICTIPLNVLHTIEFSPPMSRLRQEAINKGHIGRGGKMLFSLEPGTHPFLASAGSPCDFTLSYPKAVTHDGDVKGTVAFVLSDSSLPSEDPEQVQAKYAELVPGATISSYTFHDWRSDPFAQGTWTSYPTGFESKYYSELQKRHGNIFMASSDWAEGWRGYIDGAIEQGMLAAQGVGDFCSAREVEHDAFRLL
ncbi:lysyl oxidase-like protein 2/3/4 [Colletotrichum tofieldiae]|nr:lysyl oxidase-like protein 2/3/4 [Colletotrichum tofieldiae]